MVARGLRNAALMRPIILASILITGFVTGLASVDARADEPAVYHDGGMDTGGKLALAGGVLISTGYFTSAVGTSIVSSIGCALGGHKECSPPGIPYVPLVGGFIYASQHPYDTTMNAIGITSGVLQLAGAALLVTGLGTHRWRVPQNPRATALIPMIAPNSVGLVGRF
jgi:hypothetical protein